MELSCSQLECTHEVETGPLIGCWELAPDWLDSVGSILIGYRVPLSLECVLSHPIRAHTCKYFTRVGWKVHRLTEEELCHSNETLNSTVPDIKCIVSFQINPHWTNNSGLWKVVPQPFQEWPGSPATPNNAPAHKSMVAMAPVHDYGSELVDHPPHSPDLSQSDYFLFLNITKHCPGATELILSVFQTVHEMSLVLLFKVLSYLFCGLSCVGLSGRKFTLHLVSGKVEFNACMLSFIAVAQLLLSQPMNFSAHPRTIFRFYACLLYKDCSWKPYSSNKVCPT